MLVAAGYAAVEAASIGATWDSVERVSLDVPTTEADPATTDTEFAADSATRSMTSPPLPAPTSSTTIGRESTTSTTTQDTPTTTGGGTAPSVFALIGSDSRAGLDDTTDFGDFAGRRADVIVLAIRDGDEVGLVSIPRDLYVEDLCHGGQHRINEALAGCGGVNGLAHLVAELGNVTGLEIDHAAAVDLAGFQDVVDTVGGYEICVEHPTRDRKSGLELDAGCTNADGELTLQWLRSRYTERLVDGSWERVPGVSDLTRNERQRQFLLELAQAETSRDPGEIEELVEAIAPHLTIDDELSLTDLASWVWAYRDVDLEMAEIPVEYRETQAGASVLEPEVDVDGFFEKIPEALGDDG